MPKRVIVVPPQGVSVNVSVNVGQQQASHSPSVETPAAAPQPATHVNTTVTVGAPAWTPSTGPYVPPFTMPTSDVLRRTLPGLSHAPRPGLGDHIHTASCAEHGCALLSLTMPSARPTRPWASVGWMLIALVMWSLQYSLVLPLAYLGAVAKSGMLQAVGWFAVLFCGLGPLLSLFYLCSPSVPRSALRPWGLAEVDSPAG